MYLTRIAADICDLLDEANVDHDEGCIVKVMAERLWLQANDEGEVIAGRGADISASPTFTWTTP